MIRTARTVGLACIVICAILADFSTSGLAQEESIEKTILADQLRSQGYSCSDPISAERIAAESLPEQPVYLLKCERASYRIRLIPDQAAQVVEIN